jgi:hypothetical protein
MAAGAAKWCMRDVMIVFCCARCFAEYVVLLCCFVAVEFDSSVRTSDRTQIRASNADTASRADRTFAAGSHVASYNG